jgi:toxin ParE1/3/4
MKILLDVTAHSEIWDAAQFYDSCRDGLGIEFLDAVDEAIARIKRTPFAGNPTEGRFRRVYLFRFPYSLVYTVEDDIVFIAAVMHLKRHPDYWRERRRD